MIVAAGRADLCQMVVRDDERSVYDSAQRQLAMVVATGGPARFAGVPMLRCALIFSARTGKSSRSLRSKDAGASWNLLWKRSPVPAWTASAI